MEKIYRSGIIIALILLILFFSTTAFKNSEQRVIHTDTKAAGRQTAASKLIEQRKQVSSFPQFEIFSFYDENNAPAKNFSSDAVILKIDDKLLHSFNRRQPTDLTFRFPVSANDYIELELTRIKVSADGFKVNVINSNSVSEQNYKPGLYYTGIVKGNDNSLATLSIFENNIMAIISTESGNFVLGSVKDKNKQLTEKYVFYNDTKMITKQKFDCKAGDSYDKYYLNPRNNEISNSRTTSPVNIYFVCDYQMYLDNGSNTTSVANFVNGVFVHVKRLYFEENLDILISQIDVYTSSDPYRVYATNQTPEILYAFGSNTQDNFNGDLAHLLSTRTPVNGGIAWINVLCQSYDPTQQAGRFAFSQIEDNYLPYPVFSWTVQVITHETGHNFGSMHTHACAWPVFSGGGIGAIDSCYTAEGNCFTNTRPNNNGTIMSYCHLNGNINFLRGFGPLPGDTIRLRYSQALCIDSSLFSSEVPLVYDLLQNYPNPFNPGTYIKFALPDDSYLTLKVFDITGREVANLINNKFYKAGIFSTYFDAVKYSLASGVYLYRIDVNNGNTNTYSEIKKMVLVK